MTGAPTDSLLARTTGRARGGGGSVSAASDTVAGKVELATPAEVRTGTDTARASTPEGVKAALGEWHQNTQDFRLSLTTALPVTTADVTAAGTLYAVPKTGNKIALYDGSVWNIRSSAEFSLALTLTSGKPYDVFCYDNAGTPTLEVLVWTDDTTRATALARQDGVLVKSGAATRRYLGTLYASGSNTTEDSLAKRYLWNYYHRALRPMKVVEATNSWTYSTAAFRQANGAAGNQLDMVIGVSEDAVHAVALHSALSNASGYNIATGIGVDSTTVNSAVRGSLLAGTGGKISGAAEYVGLPGVGRHYLAWLEYGGGADTQTWSGDEGGSIIQTGITGGVWA